MHRPAWIHVAVLTALGSGGCASATGADGMRFPVAPMAAREAQTRFFDNVDVGTAMKGSIDMLQDSEFSIVRTDTHLGLVVGKRSVTRPRSGSQKLLKTYLMIGTYGLAALFPWSKTGGTLELEAAVNVTEAGEGVTVRITLNQQTLDKGGHLEASKTLADPGAYRDLFELLGRSLFMADAT